MAKAQRSLSSAISTFRAFRIRMMAALDPNRDVSFYVGLTGARVAVPGYTHTGIYRQGTTDLDLATIVANLPKDAVVADIGANVGEFTVMAAKVAKDGAVHSFEPCPLIRPYLKVTLHLNDIANVHVHDVALSDFEGSIALRFGSRTAMSSTHSNAAQWVTSIEVPAAIGDDLLSQHLDDRLDFIKIDVEGAEAAVVRGLQRTIERYEPIIVLEVDGHSDEKELLTSLRASGFEIFDYQGHYESKTVKLTHIAGITRPQAGRRNPNIIAIPRKRATAMNTDAEVSVSALFTSRTNAQKGLIAQ